MPTHRLRRTLALVTAAAVLATMTAATVAAPAVAAKPRCQGFKATIVGTQKADILRGTAKRDVIVARGGNDRIYAKGGNDVICAGGGNDTVFGGRGADRLWGQTGHDMLNGNAGPDFLAGQVGNDTLNGGIGVDTCFQGTGSGPVARCERPAPPPAAPTGPKTLVIAYSDLNGNQVFDAGDVLISRVLDSNGDGVVSVGDTIEMDRYPTTVAPGPGDFEPWGVKSHVVAAPITATPTSLFVHDSAGGTHDWNNSPDQYAELTVSADSSSFFDQPGANNDNLNTDKDSPSKPLSDISQSLAGTGDDRFLDVVFYP